MSRYQITNQRALRRAFWEAHSTIDRKKRCYAVEGWHYPADTRCAFVDWLDGLSKDGTISEALAQRATLD